MYSYLSGKLVKVCDSSAVLDINGVGYEIFIPVRYSAHLPGLGETVTFYTHYHVREDVQSLYGFLQEEEKELFKLLLGVSGIGPKSAMAVLNSVSPAEFRSSVQTEDEKRLSSIPGIGKKTASRLVLELKDKIQKLIFETLPSEVGLKKGRGDMMRDTLMALVSLGFPRQQAQAAIEKAFKDYGDDFNLEDSIKISIRYLQR